jgi:hypothetical protein
MKRASSTLTMPAESAPFRSSLLPGCLLYAEADLKPRKAFKDAVLKTDAAGACGLAHVRCGELVHAALGKDSPLINRMKDAFVGDLPQNENLPPWRYEGLPGGIEIDQEGDLQSG